MKKIILIIMLFLTINIAYAIPVPALVIGGDFIMLVIPIVLGMLSMIYFYFRKYIFQINIYLLIFSIFLYYFHFYLTKDVFLFSSEYLLFFIVIIFLGLIYKYEKIKFLNYVVIFLLLGFVFFLLKVDYNVVKYYQNINKFIKAIGKEKIDGYIIKDNFYVIYFNNGRKELVVSNCLEGADNKPLLLRKVIKDFDKQPLKNGMCIYGNHGNYEFNIMYKIIMNQL